MLESLHVEKQQGSQVCATDVRRKSYSPPFLLVTVFVSRAAHSNHLHTLEVAPNSPCADFVVLVPRVHSCPPCKEIPGKCRLDFEDEREDKKQRHAEEQKTHEQQKKSRKTNGRKKGRNLVWQPCFHLGPPSSIYWKGQRFGKEWICDCRLSPAPGSALFKEREASYLPDQRVGRLLTTKTLKHPTDFPKHPKAIGGHHGPHQQELLACKAKPRKCPACEESFFEENKGWVFSDYFVSDVFLRCCPLISEVASLHFMFW